MGLRDDFLRRIEKKRAELDEMKAKLREEERYLDALMDAYKILPRDGESSNGASQPRGLREGGKTSRAYDALKRNGAAMHIRDLVAAMGLKPNRANTQGVSSSLRAYAAKNEIFTKPAPNTYGLVEFGEAGAPVGLFADAKEIA